MSVIRNLVLIIYVTHLFINYSYANEELVTAPKVEVSDNKNFDKKCEDIPDKKILKGGWYLWEPYQFNKVTAGGYNLVGMDIELVKNIAQLIDVSIEYEQVAWQQHQKDLKDGTRDIAAGATYSDARAEYVYFSEPYRYEENSLFVMNNNDKELRFDTISEFLAQVRLQNFILGVTKGFIYADPQINLFVKDESNKDIVIEYDNDVDALEGLMRGEIDGFMSDRVVGAAAILKQKHNSYVKEIQLNIKTPIHLMFSKKSVPLDLVEKFNHEIKEFSASREYKKIVKTYLYPVMLMQTIDSKWFYFIGVMGTIAFAVSGIAIAARDNSTLFATFLLAMVPSVGGGVIRDVITNREEVGIFLTPSYMYYIIIVVLLGFSIVRLLEYYNKRANEDGVIEKFWDNILMLGDALGQAAFIVTGVSIAIMARIDPIELWGPFFAFLASNAGVIIRDLIRKKRVISCMVGTFNAEIGIIWSLIFSIYLEFNSYNPSPTGIRNMVIVVVTGCFITRLLAYYFKIPNITFRAEKVELMPEEAVVAVEEKKL
jgi:polar amino acid transport system substrate-binding protein